MDVESPKPKELVLHKNFKYRIYPNKNQERELNRILFIFKNIWNWILAENVDYYNEHKEHLKKSKQVTQIRIIRKENLEWFKYIPSASIGYFVKDFENSFKAFFKRLKRGEAGGFPKYKSFKNMKSFECVWGGGMSLVDNPDSSRYSKLLRINNAYDRNNPLLIRVRFHRDFPSDAELRSISVVKDVDEWYINVAVRYKVKEYVPNPELTNTGIDFGLSKMITFSDGTSVDHFHVIDRESAKLKHRMFMTYRNRSTRSLSNRQRKRINQDSRKYQKLRRKKQYLLHNYTRELERKYNRIAIEDMKSKFMFEGDNDRIKHMANAASIAMVKDMIQNKFTAFRYVLVDPKNTSKTCSGCGNIKDKLELSDRVYNCEKCGLQLNRDHNAAINIKKFAGL